MRSLRLASEDGKHFLKAKADHPVGLELLALGIALHDRPVSHQRSRCEPIRLGSVVEQGQLFYCFGRSVARAGWSSPNHQIAAIAQLAPVRGRGPFPTLGGISECPLNGGTGPRTLAAPTGGAMRRGRLSVLRAGPGEGASRLPGGRPEPPWDAGFRVRYGRDPVGP